MGQASPITPSFRAGRAAGSHGSLGQPFMRLTIAHITPLVALFAGVLILLMPRLLNYIVAIYLIVVDLVGLNGIYHFMR
jgi:hypothetical protein